MALIFVFFQQYENLKQYYNERIANSKDILSKDNDEINTFIKMVMSTKMGADLVSIV